MGTIMYIVIVLLVFVIITSIIWRFYSRRLILPCPVWLRWMVELENPFTKSNKASVIIEQLGLEPGMKVLDAGCGPGRLTIPIAQNIGPHGHVVAMDIQPGMLHRVQVKAQEANLHNIEYIEAGLGNGKLGPNKYDRALLVTVLGEIPDRKTALKEIFDVLTYGGILSVTEVIFDPHFQSQATVLQLAKDVGFQEKKIIGNRFAYTMQLKKPLGT